VLSRSWRRVGACEGTGVPSLRDSVPSLWGLPRTYVLGYCLPPLRGLFSPASGGAGARLRGSIRSGMCLACGVGMGESMGVVGRWPPLKMTQPGMRYQVFGG
jgi:hypothetical protein